MSDLVLSKSVTITELLSRLDTYKHNPSAIQQVILEYLEEITSGAVDIVDPTSPFVFLLESSSVNTALAINESLSALRLQYPSLAQNAEELYHHLSDKDFINRFATPSSVNFTVAMLVNDVLNKMQRDTTENCYKATIPRDSRLTIDNLVFTLQYPIDIRKYDNGVVKITHNAEITSPLDLLSSNVIDYVVRADSNGVQWLFFDINVKQFHIESTTFPLMKSVNFSQTLPHSDQFYYIRAFYRNTTTNDAWVEMKTTHSDQVFDPYDPTALVKVFEQYVTVSIPPIYQTTNLVSGEVRFDLYTTKGAMSLNLANYKPDAFGLSPIAINETRDLNIFTTALDEISVYTFSSEFVTGGSNGITFEQFRERVIHHSVGDNDLPITNKNIEADATENGFELVKNVDTVTNRIFLATQRLPRPSNAKLTTSANIGISTFITKLDKLRSLETVRYVNNRLTILSNNLYKIDNGIISILTPAEVNAIRSLPKTTLVSQVNSNNYLYTPFYYVLDDTNEEFTVRAYNLDYPVASGLSFISQNQTLQLPVNTGSYNLSKVSDGYKLRVVTKSGNFYKELADASVAAQIAYVPQGETRLAYINGSMVGKTDDNERIFEFLLETNYDLNQDDGLCILNAKMFGNEVVDTWLDLKTTFHLFYTTNSIVNGFLPDEADALAGKFILPANSGVSTHETIVLKTGSSLKNLWTRSRSMASGEDYQTYSADVPAFYERDVYETDPNTGKLITFDNAGKIQYNISHFAGEPVLNELNEQVYKFRKGDVVRDANGDPVLVSTPSISKELDILFVDGRHRFVDDPVFLAYNDELVGVLDSWVMNDIDAIQEIVLEQTNIYLYPKTTLGDVLVYIEDGGQDFLKSEQSIVVDLFVKSDIYDDTKIRAQLEATTVSIFDEFIDDTVVNMGVVEEKLKTAYGNSVQSFVTKGLGGAKNYRIVTLASEEKRLALKKVLYQQQDNSLIIKEDVTVNFYEVV